MKDKALADAKPINKKSPVYEVGRIDGYCEGYEQGYEEGYNLGIKKGIEKAMIRYAKINPSYKAITLK